MGPGGVCAFDQPTRFTVLRLASVLPAAFYALNNLKEEMHGECSSNNPAPEHPRALTVCAGLWAERAQNCKGRKDHRLEKRRHPIAKVDALSRSQHIYCEPYYEPRNRPQEHKTHNLEHANILSG